MSSHLTHSHVEPTNHDTVLMINENDNAENVVKWLKSGKFTPKLFGKHLHHTGKDISHGSRHYENLCKSLQSSYVWDVRSADTIRLRTLSLVLADAVLPNGSFTQRQAVSKCLISTALYSKSHRPEDWDSTIDTQMSLIDIIKDIRAYFLSDDGVKKMDRYFFLGHPAGSFLRTSPCATLDEMQFCEFVISRLGRMDADGLWRECENVRRIGIVLSRLAGAHNDRARTCWNCNKVIDPLLINDKVVDTLLNCGKCHAAVYCSRKCQKEAWEGGHRRKCSRLKLLKTRLNEGAEEFERAHLTGKIDGFVLSPAADLEVLLFCTIQDVRNLPQKPGRAERAATGTKVKPYGPSMKYFYENFGRVIRGEWWPCDPSEQDGDTDDGGSIPSSRLEEILQFLALDWFGMAKRISDSDDPNDVTSISDPLFRQEFGAPFSAEKLLDVYHSSCSRRYDLCPAQKAGLYETLRLVHDEELK